MASRTEADLRKRSASWRAAQGLERAPADLRPAELTAGQAQHARHLARRRGLRLRLQRILWGCGVGIAGLAMIFALRFYATAPRPGDQLESWELAPVYAKEPAARSDRVAGMQFEVYRIDATPDSVVAYWGIRGTASAMRTILSDWEVDPVLTAGTDEIAYASTSLRQPTGRNRIVGRSAFQVMAPSLTLATLQVSQVAGIPVGWRVSAPMEAAVPDPQAVRTVYMNDKLVRWGEDLLQIQAVSVGRNYTAVRYRATGRFALPGTSQRIGLKVNGKWVPWRTTWTRSLQTGGEEEAIFDALPVGTKSITVQVSPPGFHSAEVLVNQSGSIPDVAQLGPWRRDGPTLEARLLVTDPFTIFDDAGYLLDAQNRRFAVILMTDPDGHLIVRGWESQSGFEPVALVTNVTRYTRGPELNIDL